MEKLINIEDILEKVSSGTLVCYDADDFVIFSRKAIENGQVSIELPPIKRTFDVKSKLFECSNCGDCVSRIAKYCHNCGRRFEDD